MKKFIDFATIIKSLSPSKQTLPTIGYTPIESPKDYAISGGAAENIPNFRSIIGLWPSDHALAKDISKERGKGKDISFDRVRKWGVRDNIPPCYWQDLIKIAPNVNLKISMEQLAKLTRDKSLSA